MGIGVAVIGLGWWGRELARAAGHVPGLDLVVGVSPDAGERRSFAQDFGCAAGPVFADALADPAVDAVLIATPHSLHAEQVAAAGRAGRHVFVEKPFTLTAASGRAAAAACREAGAVLAVGHNRRLSGAATRLRELLEQGAF
ncbi:MAG: Gfo/Idh/MocA family oxidoreductase, partial [Rhodospirillaceae bacterium]|nr:Gfo/Idh/MocA family oxidoreductase [Rhodospirillaceae bacterium]